MHHLIIFFIPPDKDVNGGILSIFSLAKESRQLSQIHHADVFISTYPGTPTYHKNDLFENNENIYEFAAILKKYPRIDSLMLHIPEYATEEILYRIQPYVRHIQTIKDVHVNILNQNIALMPDMAWVHNYRTFANTITQTTAHVRYTNQQIADTYGIPTHLFSVSIDPSQYTRTTYEQKQNIIAYSVDKHADKDKIIKKIRKDLPEYELIEIKNLSYEDYKALVGRSKFVITFGEGFDGYLIEAAFSGGIPMAVYNEEFFPSKDYLKFKNIYPSYSAMFQNITSDIAALDKKPMYIKLNEANFNAIATLYNYQNYLSNVKNFYMKKYTYTPTTEAAQVALVQAIKQNETTIIKQHNLQEQLKQDIAELMAKVDYQAQLITDLQGQLQSHKQQLESIYHSISWKASRPLRLTRRILKK